MIRQVSARHNHDSSIPDEVFDKEVKDIMEMEKNKEASVRQEILDDHLRFKKLEAEDHQRYLAEHESKN